MPTKDTIRRNKIKNDWFAQNGPCVDCGSAEKLELDHVDPKTKNPILVKKSARIWHWGAERRAEELAKCVVRCKPCHKAKTLLNNEFTRLNFEGAVAQLTDEDFENIYNDHYSGNYGRLELCRKYGITRNVLEYIVS